MMRIGFDNEKYLKLQSEHINERLKEFGGKLYLEFGGKLFDDVHASRVLPGFLPNSKVKMLLNLKQDAEIVIAINSNDIEKNKVRGDIGITYDLDVLRLIDAFREIGLYVGSVVITMFANQASAVSFQKKLEAQDIKVYHHYAIDGYPSDVQKNRKPRGLRAKRLYRNDPLPCRCNRPGTGKRKNGDLPFPALSRQRARHKSGVC